MSPEIITAITAASAAFAGAALAQFASRNLTAANAEKFLAEAEKMRAEGEKVRAEAEALRRQSEKASAEREADKRALNDALTRLEEMEAARRKELQTLPHLMRRMASFYSDLKYFDVTPETEQQMLQREWVKWMEEES